MYIKTYLKVHVSLQKTFDFYKFNCYIFVYFFSDPKGPQSTVMLFTWPMSFSHMGYKCDE